MNPINLVIDTPEKVMYLVNDIVAGIGLMAVVVAVFIDFMEFHQKPGVKKEKRSIVETGSMFMFFFLFYLSLRFRIGYIHTELNLVRVIVDGLGILLLLTGSVVNVIGRFNLGGNWSNQVKIYKDHTFVSKGMYSIVRHPLYASIIWMFIAASVIYTNYVALLLTLFIFIPFMYYRAKQEEVLLSGEFKNYKDYQGRVGMFFPKIHL